MVISALVRKDLKPILWKAKELLDSAPLPEPPSEIPVYRAEEDASAFTVAKEEEGWRIKGKSIERAAEMTYWEMEEFVRRFQKLMERLGVDEALRKAGIKDGETVIILDYEFEWQD